MKFWAAFFCAFATFPLNTESFYRYSSVSSLRIEASRGITCPSSSQDVNPKDQTALMETSAAELVAKASTFQQIMFAVDSLVFPGEEKLHYQMQPVHQRKRQKVATNALKRLVKFLVGVSVYEERQQIVDSEKFYRLCVCATSSMTESTCEEVNQFWLTRSDVTSYLDALYSLGALAPLPKRIVTAINPLLQQLNKICIKGGRSIKETTEEFPHNFKFKGTEISSLDWAIQRIGYNKANDRSDTVDKSTNRTANIESTLLCESRNIFASREQLQLPFLILHGLVKGITNVEEMRKMVPFKTETLQTKDGKTVSERRETCWMADEGIGGLAYSGKIMAPVPFTHNIATVRDVIEKETGIYYDCCLINWYDDGECACKMHSDPDHGRLWSYDTVVVSIGETRRFNLREIPSNTLPITPTKKNHRIFDPKTQFGSKFPELEQDHHSFHLFDGDVFYMKDDCQEMYQHCVMKSEGLTNNSPRSSIVFKKSLPGLGGKRGHGLVKIKSDKGGKSMNSSNGRLDVEKRTSSTVNSIVRAGSDNMKNIKPKSQMTKTTVGIKQKNSNNSSKIK